MSGDWIKMRGNLWDDPRVAAICDATDSAECAVIGALYWLWASADQHTEDGVMPGLSLRQIDRKTGVAGFAAAVVSVGWIEEIHGGIRIVRFEEHNGSSAKRRGTEAKRKASVRKLSASDADKKQIEIGRGAELEKELEKEEEQQQPTSSDAVASPGAAVDPIWGTGLAFLRRKGVPERQARSLLGKIKQACGDIEAGALLADAEAQDITDPAPWLMAAASKRRTRAGPNGSAPQSKTLSAIQTLQGMKSNGPVDPRRDSGWPEQAALPGPGPYARQ